MIDDYTYYTEEDIEEDIKQICSAHSGYHRFQGTRGGLAIDFYAYPPLISAMGDTPVSVPFSYCPFCGQKIKKERNDEDY